MMFVDDARTASAWIASNKDDFHAEVNEPALIIDSDIAEFLNQKLSTGALYDDIRDFLLFNFNDFEDITYFMR